MDPVAQLLVLVQQERDPMTELVLFGVERTQMEQSTAAEHHGHEQYRGSSRGDGERDPLA